MGTLLQKNLEKSKRITDEIEEKHRSKFERQATYVGNGIYKWLGHHSTDTRELFLMGVATIEGINFIKE